MKIGILYIDDEANNLISFKATFRSDYNIFTAISAVEAQKVLEDNQKAIHIIITDQRMPSITGVEFLSSIIETYPEPVRILLTGYSDIQAVIDAVNKGQIFQYLTKPWNEAELKSVLVKACEFYNVNEEKRKQMKDLSITNGQLEFLLRQSLLS